MVREARGRWLRRTACCLPHPCLLLVLSAAASVLPKPPQAANPGLIVSFTLPVLPTGLTADGVRLLESCAKYGVRVDVVNIMTMDYGDSAAPGEGKRREGWLGGRAVDTVKD